MVAASSEKNWHWRQVRALGCLNATETASKAENGLPVKLLVNWGTVPCDLSQKYLNNFNVNVKNAVLETQF